MAQRGRPLKSVVEQARADRREIAEASLVEFIYLVHPHRLFGNIHREVITWLTGSNGKRHKLMLLPRDHMKSAIVAYYAVWRLTKDPTLTILFISSTANLAIKQLKFMKDILTSDIYRLYWPEMVNKEEAKREKWTEREISVDDPRRKAESVREPSIFTAGLTTNIIGLHCGLLVGDDVVVAKNAYTKDGRSKVSEQYGYLSSVEGTNAEEVIAGTRYHPEDLYSEILAKQIEIYDPLTGMLTHEPLFESFERQVETAGDGSGQFLWPRQRRSDGKEFGFDAEILRTKKAQYSNQTHFRAQYYNDPHDVDSAAIQREQFQYYDEKYLHRQDYQWFFRDKRLNVFAAVDFAYSNEKNADFTSIVVVGVDGDNNYYILEIDRFKTKKISEYFDHILRLYEKWGFRKIRCEVSVAQAAIVEDIKDNYIKKLGLSLTVDEFRPTRWKGAKEERIAAVLEPKYANRQIWHYRGGYTQALEEELIYTNPAHDDIKDALASVIDFAAGKSPLNTYRTQKALANNEQNYHPRWGGVI